MTNLDYLVNILLNKYEFESNALKKNCGVYNIDIIVLILNIIDTTLLFNFCNCLYSIAYRIMYA